MGNFFEVLKKNGVSKASLSTELDQKGLKLVGIDLTNKETGELLTFEENEFFEEKCSSTAKRVKDYVKYNKAEKQLLIDIVLEGDLTAYNGGIFCGNVALDYDEAIKHLHRNYPTLDFPSLERIVEGVKQLRKLDTLPKFKSASMVLDGVDNGFRFPKVAYQMLKYWLFSDHRKYIFTVMNEGDAGKSTFSNFLRCLYDLEYGVLDSKFLSQFSTSFIASKRMVVFNDCSSSFMDNAHIVKQLSGGDVMSIEAKGQQAFGGKVNANLLFLGNEVLNYNILDSGMRNRFINAKWVQPRGLKRDPKWVDYQWSVEEIAFQIQLARDVEEFDYVGGLKETVKAVLADKSAFDYLDYAEYCSNERNCYSEKNFVLFHEIASKYFIWDEREAVLKAKKDRKGSKGIEGLYMKVVQEELPF